MNMDDMIKKSIRDAMQRIDDPGFTEKIVDAALVKKASARTRSFMGFTSLIVGMICLIVSSGLLLLYYTRSIPRDLTNFDPNTGVILVALSATFLLYDLLGEFTIKYPPRGSSHDRP